MLHRKGRIVVVKFAVRDPLLLFQCKQGVSVHLFFPLGLGKVIRQDKISAVFQEDCLCEDFSAISNIRAVTGKKISKENISSTLKELGLSSNDLTLPSRELSGGMKRRVAIARALLAESDLIIMDEPFKGLDIETRSSVIKVILNSISQSKRTLIIITHSPEEAELLSSDKIIVIH